jgi:hypothetical protein
MLYFFLGVVAILRRCYPHRLTFYRVVTHNGDNFSVLYTTVQENDRHCCLHRWKIVGVAVNSVENVLIRITAGKYFNSNISTN